MKLRMAPREAYMSSTQRAPHQTEETKGISPPPPAHLFSLILNILQGTVPEKSRQGSELDAAQALLPFPPPHATIPTVQRKQKSSSSSSSVWDEAARESEMDIQSKSFKLDRAEFQSSNVSRKLLDQLMHLIRDLLPSREEDLTQ